MVNLIVGTTVDDNSIRKASNEIQRKFDRIGQETGSSFMAKFGDGAEAGSTKVQKAMNTAEDAVSRLRVEQSKLDDLMASGSANQTRILQQSEKLAKARRDEALAVRRAADAYKDYSDSGGNAAQAFMDGLRNGAGFSGAGRDAADHFTGGFGSAAGIARLGAAAGPIGVALAGVAVLGVVAGKQLGDAIAQGMETIHLQDQFQARMGLDESSISQYSAAAGRAYANNFGTSVADNLGAAQSALQSGLINPGSSQADIQHVVEQVQSAASTTGATVQELSRSMTTLMRTGFADNATQALDVITAGFQKGLNVSNDWLDTLNEYSTQFRKLGLDSADFTGLLKQGLEGGARDTDKVADSLKEFSIRAVDGSKLTGEGFKALGFDADDMGRRFSAGGESARQAFGSVLNALKQTGDEQQKALILAALFGTQWEDMGDAINHLDLSTARNQFTDMQGTSDRSTKTATDNFVSNWQTATKTVEQFFTNLKTKVADFFTGLPIIKDIPAMITAAFSDPNPVTPGITNTYPGQQSTPVRPSPGGGIAPPQTGAIQGNGTFLDSILGKNPGVAAPPGLIGPAAGGPAGAAPAPGDRTPMLTDAQQQAQKDAEKSAKEAAKLPDAPVVPYDTSVPGWAQGLPMSAQNSYISAHNDLLEKQARVDQLHQSSVATQQDILKAENDLTKSQQQWQAAQESLATARQSAYDKETKQLKDHVKAMDDIGVALDADLGISKGLPGIAENLVKFIGSLAAAPLMGPLAAIKNAAPDQGGSGLIGMLAAQNPKYQSNVPGAQGYQGGYAPVASGQYMTAVPGGNPNVNAMLSLAQNASGGQYSWGGTDLVDGLADCSGSVSELVAVLTGKGTGGGRLFSTANAAQVLPQLGFQRGFQPGAMNVGFYNDPGGPGGGHMAATLPNGVNFESGGNSGGISYGGNAAGALSPQFTDHFFLPVGGPSYSAPYSTTPAPTYGAGGGAGSGLGFPGIAGPPQALPGVGAGPLPGPAPIGQSLIPGQVSQGAPGGTNGGNLLGGLPMAAATTAASTALDALAPGSGAAASLLMQLGNRAIGYGAGMAANAVSGLFETFSLSGSGGMTDPMKTLPGRVLGALAQARPQIPNSAAQGQKQPGQDQQQQQQNPQQGQPGSGPMVNIENVHQQPGQTPDSVAQGVANQFRSAEYAGGFYR